MPVVGYIFTAAALVPYHRIWGRNRGPPSRHIYGSKDFLGGAGVGVLRGKNASVVPRLLDRAPAPYSAVKFSLFGVIMFPVFPVVASSPIGWVAFGFRFFLWVA